MQKERIVKSEILVGVREKGFSDLDDVYAGMMENASLNVIKKGRQY